MNIKEKISSILDERGLTLKRVVLLLVILAVIITSGILVSRFIKYSSYTSYEEIITRETSENYGRYREFNNMVVLYSEEGISLLDNDLERKWSYSMSFANPEFDSCGKCFLIYDKGNTSAAVFNKDGKLGEFNTDMSILRGKCTDSGNTALLLSNEEHVSLKYYTGSGEENAVISYDTYEDGFPLDFDISDDGQHISASLEKITENGIESDIVVYDFGKAGEESDHISASVQLKDELIPVIISSGNNIMTVETKGFTVYDISGLEVRNKVGFENDIQSLFYNDEYAGFVFNDGGTRVIRLYSINGELMTEVYPDLNYNSIIVNPDSFTLINNREFRVYNTAGIKKFEGRVTDSNIKNLVRINGNRYLLVQDGVTKLIKGTGLSRIKN